VRSWTADGVTRVQILAVLRNDSSTPVQFVPSGSSYRIFDARGRAVATGVFTYAVPDRLAHGEIAYLVETRSALFVSPRGVDRVVVVPSVQSTSEAATLLSVTDVTWRTTATGVEASGVVTNNTGRDIDEALVAVLFFASNDQLIGAVYDVADVQLLGRDESRRFSTAYPGTAPLASGDIARAEPIAYAPGQ
jgi:hypothetical protein